MASPDVEVTFRIRMSGERLDAYVRTQYAGDELDPVPGEPEPGAQMARDWVAEAKYHLDDPAQKSWIDTLWWDGEYVEGIDVSVVESRE